MKLTCRDCRFWGEDACCHRYPPVVVDDPDSKQLVTAFVCTLNDDWCGEFKPKEKANDHS